MGIAAVRDAFTAAMNGTATVTHARLRYENQNAVEYQRLEFDGHFVANGKPFKVRSDRINRQGDLLAAAAATAANLLAQEARAAAAPPAAEGPAP